MYCKSCGQQLPENATACTSCGQPVVAAPAAPEAAPQSQPAQAQPVAQLPSIYNLACPSCGSKDIMATGLKGALGKSMAVGAAFGAIGNMVASSNAAADYNTQPIQYRCSACKNKFESGPLLAAPDEMLSAPCNIHFERKGSFVGAAVAQIVYLNGLKMGPVKNGKAIDFPTWLKYNTLFVTDQHGVAFKGMYKFEAPAGGNVTVRFNRKFL